MQFPYLTSYIYNDPPKCGHVIKIYAKKLKKLCDSDQKHQCLCLHSFLCILFQMIYISARSQCKCQYLRQGFRDLRKSLTKKDVISTKIYLNTENKTFFLNFTFINNRLFGTLCFIDVRKFIALVKNVAEHCVSVQISCYFDQ